MVHLHTLISAAVLVRFDESSYEVDEDIGTVEVCARMEGESELSVAVQLSTEDGSAIGTST